MAEDSVEPTNMETPPMPRMLVLKVAVAVMGVLLLAGFALVVTTIVSRVSNPQAAARVIGPGGQFGLTEVAIERGDIIRSVNLNEDRAAVHIAGEKGEEVIILNVKSGAELGRFRLRPLTGLAEAAKP